MRLFTSAGPFLQLVLKSSESKKYPRGQTVSRSEWLSQGCWLCQRGGADACNRYKVPKVWTLSKVAIVRVFWHKKMGRSLPNHSRWKLHEVKAPLKALGQPPRVDKILLMHPTLRNPVSSNHNLICLRSCLRAKL